MARSDSEADQDPPPSRMLSVWPTELPNEWRARTWYGKIWFLAHLPLYAVGIAAMSCLAIFLGVIFWALKSIWRVIQLIDRIQPNTYKGENDG